MSIPDIWPTPCNSATRVRVFRINVERPVVGDPVVTFNVNEAIDAGSSTFEKYRPDCNLTASLPDLLADAELGTIAGQVASGLEQIAYTLYSRLKTAMETPAPETPSP